MTIGKIIEIKQLIRIDYEFTWGVLFFAKKGIDDRLKTLRLPLSGNKHATIVRAYAPTMTNLVEVKDKFYNDLDDVISATQQKLSYFVCSNV